MSTNQLPKLVLEGIKPEFEMPKLVIKLVIKGPRFDMECHNRLQN